MSTGIFKDAAEAACIVAKGIWSRIRSALLPLIAGGFIGAAAVVLTMNAAALDAAQSFAAHAGRAQLVQTVPATSAVVALMAAPAPAPKGKRR